MIPVLLAKDQFSQYSFYLLSSVFMCRILFSERYFQTAVPMNCLCASPVTTCLVVIIMKMMMKIIIIIHQLHL